MAYTDLSNEEKAALNEYVRQIRATVGELARVRNHAGALNYHYATIQTILGELGSNEEIPDGSGLAGAMPLTKSETITMTAHIQGLLSAYGDGHLQMWAKAAGPSNLVG